MTLQFSESLRDFEVQKDHLETIIKWSELDGSTPRLSLCALNIRGLP